MSHQWNLEYCKQVTGDGSSPCNQVYPQHNAVISTRELPTRTYRMEPHSYSGKDHRQTH